MLECDATYMDFCFLACCSLSFSISASRQRFCCSGAKCEKSSRGSSCTRPNQTKSVSQCCVTISESWRSKSKKQGSAKHKTGACPMNKYLHEYVYMVSIGKGPTSGNF